MPDSNTSIPILSKYADRWLRLVAGAGGLTLIAVVALVWYYFTPKYTRVGYQPSQPAPFSHQFHVGQLGMSCKYCHTHVDKAPHSNVPATQTCMNCHLRVKSQSPLLAEVRKSWVSGTPVRWNQVHRLPDYAYFNHAIHINRGVSCRSCHGQINDMKVVYHAEPLSMGWCLECHRNPAPHLRPRDEVYNLDWNPSSLRRHWKLDSDCNENCRSIRQKPVRAAIDESTTIGIRPMAPKLVRLLVRLASSGTRPANRRCVLPWRCVWHFDEPSLGARDTSCLGGAGWSAWLPAPRC